MKRKRGSLLLCLVLCLSLVSPALAAENPVFSDVPTGSWFEEGAVTCAQRGIMVGTGEGLFSPDTELTAAECLTLALRLYDLQRGGDGTLERAPEDWGRMALTLNDGTVFQGYGEDAPSLYKWYRDAAYTVKAWGLQDEQHPGFSGLLEWSGSDLDHPATRQEFALALRDAAGELEKKFSVDAIYDDNGFLLREENQGIFTLYEAGILGGMDEFGTFGGREYLTRAEAAVMVARVLDPSQRLTAAPTPPNAYDQAVIDLRSGFTYSRQSERTYETEDCTIFVYDRGGAMHTGPGNITIIYKPGSQPGAGTVLSAETPNTWATLQTGVDMLRLSEDRKTLTYGYLFEHEVLDLAIMENALPAGLYTYTVDLPTGVTTPGYAPLSYESSLSALSYGRNYTLEKQLAGTECTLLLRQKPLTAWYPDIKDYELWLVRKDETGSRTRLLLPSTVISEDRHYAPTDRAPDSLEISEDGRTLTYTYHFDEALEDYHDAGTYTYTVDLATGELTVEHAPL